MDVVIGEDEEEKEEKEEEVEQKQQQQKSSSLEGDEEKEETPGLSPSPVLPCGSLGIEMLKSLDARLCDFGDLSHSQPHCSSVGGGAGGEEPRRLGAPRYALSGSELEGGVRSRAGAMTIDGESRHEERSCVATAQTSREPGHADHIQMLEQMLARARGRGGNGSDRYGPQGTDGTQMVLNGALAAADVDEDEGIALLSPEGVPQEERCLDQEQLHDLPTSRSSMRPRRLARLQRCLACCPACVGRCCSIL